MKVMTAAEEIFVRAVSGTEGVQESSSGRF